MDRYYRVGKKFIFIVIALCVLTLTLIPLKVSAQGRQVVKRDAVATWITVGGKSHIKPQSIKRAFGFKNIKANVTYSTNPGSRLKVSKKGTVSVKKPDQNCKNYVNDKVKASFVHKGVKYTYWCSFVVVYEYDDANPMPNDVKPDQIKRFKQAYKTGNTSGLSKKEKKIFKKVKKAVDYSKSGKNRYEKCKRLNDWITKNVKYESNQNKKYLYTIEGPMLHGKAACNGYVNAFKMCASVMGIPCDIVVGHKNYNDIAGHAWNIVKLDDKKWYHIDVTENDTDDKRPYAYTVYKGFCLNDKQMYGAGNLWSGKRKCNGTKYTLKNYEKDYFVHNRKDLYNAIKRAVKEKREYVFFYEPMYDYTPLSANSAIASQYAGRNIVVQKVSKHGDIKLDVPRYNMPAYLCKDNIPHNMTLYKITYPKDKKIRPFRYISNGQELEKLVREAVANGSTVVKNVAMIDGYDEGGLTNPETGYMYFGKYITFRIGDGVMIPNFMNPGKKDYYLADLYVDYSHINEKVYQVANDSDVKAALDDAIANRRESINFYAPNYPAIGCITDSYVYDTNLVYNIHSETSQYGYCNPFTGETRDDSFWVYVTISYK